jgi:S-(hydroxymethyl)glutathione dehydrogenase/alcohol dehydrogenase
MRTSSLRTAALLALSLAVLTPLSRASAQDAAPDSAAPDSTAPESSAAETGAPETGAAAPDAQAPGRSRASISRAPKAGEVLVEIKATGVCHTDEFTRSGADPEGLFPAIFGHEGAGVVVEVGPGVTSLKPGDHVIPLYTPECRAVQELPLAQDQPLHGHPRHAGQGLMPDGTSRFSIGGKTKIHHYMGCSTFSQPHRAARDRARQGPRGRALRQDLLHRLRRDHGRRRGALHRQGRAGANVVVFGLGGIGLNVIQGRAWSAPTDRRRRHQPKREASARASA